VNEELAQVRREALADARRRLAEPSGDGDQAQAFWSFGDAVRAAGLAAVLGEDDDAVRELLGRAAREALTVFALRGTHVGEIRGLDDAASFTDTSATSPGTLVQALHAAAAGDEDEALEQLAGLRPEAYHSEQVVAGAVLEAFAPVLQRAAAGAGDLADQARDALEGWGEGDVGQHVLLTQLRALEALGERDGERFEHALGEVAEAQRAYRRSAGEGGDEDPELALGLPVRGLRALAARRGL
jgi:hypothetical protein